MEDYSRMHRYYNKVDGMLAVGVYAASMLLFYVAGLIVRHQGTRLFVPASIVSLVVVLIALIIRKEGPRTVGISIKNILKSAFLGLATGAAFFFAMRIVIGASLFERAYGGAEISRFLGGDRFFHVPETPFWEWFPLVFLFVFVTAVHQEILMRGYVQTRLNGLIKSEFAATIITGFLFVIFFMPLHTILVGESLSWVFLSSIPLRMMWMFALHCWLYLLYRTYNNLAAPIIFHIFFSFHSNAALVHSSIMGF